MKRTLSVIIFAILATYSASAQNIGEVFLTMPESIVFGLDAAAKEKLMLNPKDTAEVVVERGEFGEVRRLALSADFVSLRTSEAGATQIKLLPLVNDSKIICVVKTVCAKVCDSRVQFYTTKWIPIPQGDLFPKKDKGWFIKPDVDRDSQDFQNACAALDMNPISIRLSPDDTSLEAEYDIKDYLGTDDYNKIEPYLTGVPKKFVWDKSSYK
ncbi:MAG: DUF3256 family protein [Prevotella sp.]|jgi:hypothetical protein|nr:DUF3256 family protein [Prevotella sp.]